MRFITLLCCFLAASVAMAKDFTVATVDLQKLFKVYPGTVTAQKKFDALTASKKKDLADSEKILTKLQKELKNSDGLSDKLKKQKQQEFQDEAQNYQDEKNHIQAELNNKQQEMTLTLLGQIKAIVAKVAIKEGADMVLQSSDVLDTKVSMDLTADVLKSFPKSADKDSE